jgi:ABC-type phosphate/phosphonate transport system substrate-binding protein
VSSPTRYRHAAILLGLAALGLPTLAQKLVVHLPSTPLEGATRQAAALGRLSEYLSKNVPGLQIEPQIFRRVHDANEFLDTKAGEVSLVLCDAELLVDLPRSLDLQPTHRLVNAGKTTYRRLIVVPAGRTELKRLADLRGKKLAVVEAGGPSADAWLARAVFADLLQPKEFFASVTAASDEIAAINEVLFSQADAALVADFNPLLARNVGSTLRVVYTSDELSMPVLLLRSGALGERQAALEAALTGLGSQEAGRAILAELGVERLAPIAAGERQALRALPPARTRAYELASAPGIGRATPLAPPSVQDLPLTLDLGLPARQPFSILLDLPASDEPPPGKPPAKP